MRIERLRYSSRSGYQIDLRQAGGFVLDPHQVYLLWVQMKAQLSQQDLNQHFTLEEQAVLHRYQKLMLDKQAELTEKHPDLRSQKKIKSEFAQFLEVWMEFIPQGGEVVIQKLLGWDNLDSN